MEAANWDRGVSEVAQEHHIRMEAVCGESGEMEAAQYLHLMNGGRKLEPRSFGGHPEAPCLNGGCLWGEPESKGALDLHCEVEAATRVHAGLESAQYIHC